MGAQWWSAPRERKWKETENTVQLDQEQQRSRVGVVRGDWSIGQVDAAPAPCGEPLPQPDDLLSPRHLDTAQLK